MHGFAYRASAAVMAIVGALPAMAAPGGVPLASHRAVYDLELDNASDRSGINAVKGRIVYEFEGSSCEGYTTRHRIVIQMDTDEFSRLQDQQMSSFEEGDGSLFRFVSKTFLDGVEDKVVEGTAKRRQSDVSVELKNTEKAITGLGPALFPAGHTKSLLQKAAAGETFFELPIYDGSDEGSTAFTTTVIIGKEVAAGKYDAGSDKSNHRAWPVSIAYFDEKADGGGEGLPIYRINFLLFEDGITQDLVIDYGDFAMKGELVDLDLRKGEEACTQN
jgi:hypothetical protein